ncbi:MAG: biotin transporter BioY [bacterium]
MSRPFGPRSIAFVALFIALTTVGAFIKIPMWPVPVTMQSFFVLAAGGILGARLGALSQIAYLLFGLAGLPIFAGGGGPTYLLKPSFGYILGFAPAALAVGYTLERWGRSNYIKVLLSMLLGTAIIYLIGLPYLFGIMRFHLQRDFGLGGTLMAGLAPFIPGDVLKIALAAAVVRSIPLRVSMAPFKGVVKKK